MVDDLACDEGGTPDGPTARPGWQLGGLHRRRLHLHPGRLRARPVSAPRPAEAAADSQQRPRALCPAPTWASARAHGWRRLEARVPRCASARGHLVPSLPALAGPRRSLRRAEVRRLGARRSRDTPAYNALRPGARGRRPRLGQLRLRPRHLASLGSGPSRLWARLTRPRPPKPRAAWPARHEGRGPSAGSRAAGRPWPPAQAGSTAAGTGRRQPRNRYEDAGWELLLCENMM